MDYKEQFFQLSEAFDKITVVESFQEEKEIKKILQHADVLISQAMELIGKNVEWIK